jgi:hypothetical protein
MNDTGTLFVAINYSDGGSEYSDLYEKRHMSATQLKKMMILEGE